jgi:hypothetical protein
VFNNDWQQFKGAFLQCFKTYNEGQVAHLAIQTIKYKAYMAEDYVSQFNNIAKKTQYSDVELEHYFKLPLPEKVKDRIAETNLGNVDTLAKLQAFVIRTDRHARERKTEQLLQQGKPLPAVLNPLASTPSLAALSSAPTTVVHKFKPFVPPTIRVADPNAMVIDATCTLDSFAGVPRSYIAPNGHSFTTFTTYLRDRCNVCGQQGHCQDHHTGEDKPTCSHCGWKGHTQAACFCCHLGMPAGSACPTVTATIAATLSPAPPLPPASEAVQAMQEELAAMRDQMQLLASATSNSGSDQSF